MSRYKWLMSETREKSDERLKQILDIRFKRNKPERKSDHEQYPEILTELQNLSNTHSGSAQDRRRDDFTRFNGLSAVDCNKHIKQRLIK
ncbi:unnamed protein product [Didymodactylos carnosus]|uniref:Uncharacterized protein n=1 Tax=Didymodactylos carnosus TaxID=1234261 RepID=A0A815H2K7_9BILA|nr:unnamed protein product [Didymodactylos carnosus]CAF1348486.1 unnamed protein product [Didymodactylos carnosus]CAF4070061.1 unnamed protein product [Didymodactylos carnosus]CAF4216380.1 unnamed protein product [Didymodactylos carnosus]